MSVPNHPQIDSPFNHGPLVGVLTWFLLAATVLAVAARAVTKLVISKRWTADDYMVFVALALSIGQAIAISLQISNGVGQHEANLSLSQQVKYYKCDYASKLLFILNLCFAKLSVLQMLKAITPVKQHIRMVLFAGIFVLLWSLTSELAFAFECSVPRTWDVKGHHCIDHAAFWNTYGVFNLVTEAALLALPFVILWKIQTQRKKKAIIICCFASRILVFGAIIVQMIYNNQAKDATDVTFDTWPAVISMEAVQSVSVITACIPCLKPFLESLESGMLRVDDLRRRGMGDAYGYGSHNLTDLSSSRAGGKEKPQFSSNSSRTKHFKALPNVSTVISATKNEDRERDGDSQKSSARIIKYTRTWSVE